MKQFLSFLTLLFMGVASSNLYAQYAQWPPFGQFALSEEQLRYKEEMRKNKVASQHRSDGNCTGSNNSWTERTTKYDARGNLIYSSSSSTFDSRGAQMTYKYDDKDNITEEADYGVVRKKVEYAYDAAGRLTKRKIRDYDYFEAGEPHQRPTGGGEEDWFTWNDKGKLLEHIDDSSKVTYKYNAAEDEVERAYFAVNGGYFFATGRMLDDRLLSRSVSTYDRAGRKTKEEAHDSTGLLIGKTLYAYDKAGRRTKEEKYDASGHLSSSTADTYDKAGHKTKEQAYEKGDRLSSITGYTYDEAGNETKEESYDLDGKTLTGATTFKYDPKGLLIQKSDSRPNGRCIIYGYQFYP